MPEGGRRSLRLRNGLKPTPELLNREKQEQDIQPFTLTWDQLEDWQRDNEFIVNGYRRVQNHWKGCLESVYGYLHNETINIHTHLWGAALFVYFCATFYGSYIKPFSPVATWHDSAVFLIFLLSAAVCLSTSALYHTSGCHSEKVASRCHTYDYSGIIILTVGSFYPALYYGFFCHVHLLAFYLAGISLAGLGAAYVVLSPEYSKPTHRGARTLVFIGLGLSGLVPVSHLIATHELHALVADMGLGWLLTSALLYITGALLYANRIPERLAPGKFDYFFASHQIFHVCVILAALAHYRSVVIGSAYRLLSPGTCGT
ncbi:ADIPOR-like receptor SPBC12C2.09c [Leucoagaricus sp. SymC.cos]|nr:ADIPOR-like receptor SPBC12C2.09c [Leucoagaricus sp. SymC.cos]